MISSRPSDCTWAIKAADFFEMSLEKYFDDNASNSNRYLIILKSAVWCIGKNIFDRKTAQSSPSSRSSPLTEGRNRAFWNERSQTFHLWVITYFESFVQIDVAVICYCFWWTVSSFFLRWVRKSAVNRYLSSLRREGGVSRWAFWGWSRGEGENAGENNFVSLLFFTVIKMPLSTTQLHACASTV